ncbi:MAG: DUF1461 domain-containing protein [Coriobacteriia bacterium]|nr:DUF1461 domain-containing protein [Coriobacteriia bacterium]
MFRWTVRALIALALALFALGVAVVPLQAPQFTHALSSRYSRAQEAGLSSDQMLSVAQSVRVFVVQGTGALPERVAGREGFDEAAVAHLVDVRRVLDGARVATGLLGLVLVAWFAVAWRARRYDEVAAALGLGVLTTLLVPMLAVLVGVVDFDGFFTAFHGVFFASGTWTFPADSLLILTFPEPFWVLSGLAWGVGVLSVAGVYGLAWVLVRRRATTTTD